MADTKTKCRQALRKVRPYAEVLGSVAEAALSARSVGLGALAGLAGIAAKTTAQIEAWSDWETVYEGRRGSIARLALEELPSYSLNRGRGCAAGGFEVFWADDRIYCTPGFSRQARVFIGDRLREKFRSGARLIVSRNADADLTLVRETRAGIESDVSSKILRRVRPALELGAKRVALLYGRPGVGKTSAATQVARELADLVLFVGGSGTKGLGDLPLLCEMLEPGAVVLDDVETFEDLSILLDFLESTTRPQLVLMTTNVRPGDDRLQPALLRCGRVDETFEVSPRDAGRFGIFRALPDEVWEKIRGWSAASLQEVAFRAEIYGADFLELEEIEQREKVP